MTQYVIRRLEDNAYLVRNNWDMPRWTLDRQEAGRGNNLLALRAYEANYLSDGHVIEEM